MTKSQKTRLEAISDTVVKAIILDMRDRPLLYEAILAMDAKDEKKMFTLWAEIVDEGLRRALAS